MAVGYVSFYEITVPLNHRYEPLRLYTCIELEHSIQEAHPLTPVPVVDPGGDFLSGLKAGASCFIDPAIRYLHRLYPSVRG